MLIIGLNWNQKRESIQQSTTHRGLFQYTSLPFGIASAPALFQRTMESLLGDIPMCRPYLDDIIVSGKNPVDHLNNLNKVLDRIEKSGLRLQKSKCEFFKDLVEYLGHILNAQGLRPLQKKMEAIQQAPRPRNQSEPQAYLGLLGYYRKFIPNLSHKIAPLTQLLQKEYVSDKTVKKGKAKSKKPSNPDPKFLWGTEQENAFQESKELLQNDTCLVHFDPAKPIFLQTDASPYGLGAIISHHMPDGSERPIGFASRTLTGSERNYAQYKKEGLSIIFGLKKFHKYLHGKHFTIVTDHKPLVALFGNQKPANPMSSARVARWHMILSAYEFDIIHKSGTNHSNADALSRLPLTNCEETAWLFDRLLPTEREQINLLCDVEKHPVEATEVKRLTDKDPVLSRVRQYILDGWPKQRNLGEDFTPFSQKREELSVEDGIVLWGHRVVIPSDADMRISLIEELHATHPGIVKMKALARSYFWWPAVDRDLERKSKECELCQTHQKQPQPAPVHPWEFPDKPWIRLHIDYVSIQDQDVLKVVDAYSKWIEAVRVNNATANATITVLRRLFATYGLPETIVSDNGTQFVSEEFAQFLSSNNIEYAETAPKHPASNGLAERAVQTVKNGVKKMTRGNLELKLQQVLLRYRITLHATTGQTPSELLFKRRIKTRLDQVRPNLARKVKLQQTGMQQRCNRKAKSREYYEQDPVWAKNFASGPTWLKGVITDILNPSMCVIELDDCRKIRRHYDQIRLRMVPTTDPQSIYPSSEKLLEKKLVVMPNDAAPQIADNDFGMPLRLDNESTKDQRNSARIEPDISQVTKQPLILETSNQQCQPDKPSRVSTRSKTPSVKLKDYIVYK
ncbi:hypothetical protein BSL78_09735 [Apostichopus japonicus]|uniref:Integrase catalytic domain-containing protein n=1 Tax=Stichopus japonicus TaxID=307972 RepID=A0A2G8KZC2_STIJA|nr:hypothetical protein BSL78_09735 [Apostichopus japonicus]